MNIEAGVVLDTREGDEGRVLADIRDAIDWWLERARPGVHRVRSHADVRSLAKRRIVGARRKRAAKAALGRGKEKAPKLEALITAPRLNSKSGNRPTRKPATAKRTASRPAAAGAGSSRGRGTNPAFMEPMLPSPALAAVVGGKAVTRQEIAKRLWAYIKRNMLQDEQDLRYIIADDKLRQVFGGKKRVSIFGMTALVTQHLRRVR